MRLQKIKENEEVQYYRFLDYINCGACYLLAEWHNREEAIVTLNKDTILGDLHKKHGGLIYYSKFCSETFSAYKSMSGNWYEEDFDKVIDWTKIDPYEEHYYTRLLKTLVTGEGLKECSMPSCIVRWANEGSSRGEDWYRLLDD